MDPDDLEGLTEEQKKFLERIAPEKRPILIEQYRKAAEAQPGFDRVAQEIANETGTKVKLAPVKGLDRATAKIASDYGGDPAKIKDLVRGTIEVESMEDAQRVIEEIKKKYQVLPSGQRNLLDPSVNPVDGYRDAKFNVVLENGTVAEVQVNVPKMLEAKSKVHKLYEQRSELERVINDRGGNPTVAEQTEIDRLNREMKKVYDPAWEETIKNNRSRPVNTATTVAETTTTESKVAKTSEALTTEAATTEAVTTEAGALNKTSKIARTVVATEEASKTSRLSRLLTPSESQYTWRLSRAIGMSENAAGKVATVTKAGGVVLKVLGPVAGGIMTYNAISERANGNSYTALLDASGLPPTSSVRDSYSNYQDKNIAEGVALTIPLGVTQAYWALSSGLRWAVGDVDHRKLLANIVVRANSGTEAAKTREAVREYVDSAIPWFHHLSAQKKQNVIDNVLAMKNSGKMQDWSQLPGLIGTPGNMLRLQDSPEYFLKNNTDAVKLPDVNKTNEALYGSDEKNPDGSLKNPGLSAEIAEAAQIENMRKRSQIPDINWEEARERFTQGGKDAMMNYLSGQMPEKMWESTKTFFSHALDVFDLDKDVEALRNLWNRPLDTLTGAFVNFVNGAKDGEVSSQPIVMDENGKPRVLTPELLEEIKAKQPPEGSDTTGYKKLSIENRNGENVIVATDLTKEELDRLQSGELKLASATELMAQVKPSNTGIEDASSKPVDKPPPTLDELRTLAEQIAKESDPKKKQSLQEEFNSRFYDATPEMRKEFVEDKKSAAQDQAAESFIAFEKKSLAEAKGRGEDPLAVDGFDDLVRSQEKYKWYSTGIANSTFVINGTTYKTYNTKMKADTNGDNVVDDKDDAIGVNITERADGTKTVNIVNSKMFVPVGEDGQPLAKTDPALIAKLQQETARREAEQKREAPKTKNAPKP
jgi:hypothetical protein